MLHALCSQHGCAQLVLCVPRRAILQHIVCVSDVQCHLMSLVGTAVLLVIVLVMYDEKEHQAGL